MSDLYQWNGGEYGTQTRGCGSDRPPVIVPGQPEGGCRFRDEVYVQPQPREFRSGDNTMIVYGNVYIDQNSQGGCRTRCDGRQEYYGNNYNYGAYCDPRWQIQRSYSMPYYEYGVRVYGGGTAGYDRSCNTGCYDYGWNNGGNYSGGYSRDTVYGGRGGYSADRTRYQGGWDYGYQGGWDYGYQGGPPVAYGPGGSYSRDTVSGGRGGYYADRERYNNGDYYGGGDQAGQIFDFALKGFDAYAGYDIARRYANNDRYRSQTPGWNGGYGGGWSQPQYQQQQQLQNWRSFRDRQQQIGLASRRGW